MEISVLVKEILPVRSWVKKSDGSTVNTHSFLGVVGGQYPKTLCFLVHGTDRWNALGVVQGNSYLVSFDVVSRPWNDKWITECTAWRAVPLDASGQAHTQQQVMQQAGNVAQQQYASHPQPAYSAPAPQPAYQQAPTQNQDLPF